MNTESSSWNEEGFLFFNGLFEGMRDEAEGRACIPLEDDECRLLERVAAGQCRKEEREEAIGMLVANREAMAYFACALKGEEYVPVGGSD